MKKCLMLLLCLCLLPVLGLAEAVDGFTPEQIPQELPRENEWSYRMPGQVILAGDGVDALAKLRENEVDIVFTDLEMPRMHGYDLIRELRFGAAYKNLPIVVVSSRSGNKHKQQATELGATDYLIKPFSPEIIREALVRHCGFGNNPLPPTHLIVKTP